MIALEIRLFGKVRIQGAAGHTSEKWIAAFNREIATLGLTLGRDIMDGLSALEEAAFMTERSRLLTALVELSGKSAEHTRLFSGFPYSVPEQQDYFIQRVVGELKHRLGLKSNHTVTLSCGHSVDLKQFDLDSFGACPICQYGVSELRSPTGRLYTYRDLTPLKVLGSLTSAQAVAEGDRLLARQSSLSSDEKTWLLAVIAEGATLAVPGKLFRETLPFVYLMGGATTVSMHLTGATDILRIAALVSDSDADLSLQAPVKFRLSTSHSKRLLALLEAQANLEEDLLRHRERWLRFGEHVHIGTARNSRRFPKTAAAFDILRNRPEAVDTFNRRVEKLVRSAPPSDELIGLLSLRPAEFARRLDYLLRSTADPAAIMSSAQAILPDLTTKLLFELHKYFGARGAAEQRIFLPKGDENRMHVAPDRRATISSAVLTDIRSAVYSELLARLRILPPLGAVHIDPLLKEHMVPFNRRGDSATLSQLTKGSRYPFQGDIVRLFVHWIGRVDVDLSIVLYDSAMAIKGHVAFTNLQYPGCVHSGDIQDAPDGASEFIDFDVATLRGAGILYVASWVHSYRGQPFSQFACFAGFMQRDSLKSGAVYEPQSVSQKFEIDASNTSHMPLVFDLEERKVVFADMAAGNRPLTGVHNGQDKHKILMEGVLSLGARKPTLYDVVSAHVEARGQSVGPEAADRSFSTNNIAEIIEMFVDADGVK